MNTTDLSFEFQQNITSITPFIVRIIYSFIKKGIKNEK